MDSKKPRFVFFVFFGFFLSLHLVGCQVNPIIYICIYIHCNIYIRVQIDNIRIRCTIGTRLILTLAIRVMTIHTISRPNTLYCTVLYCTVLKY